MDGIIVIDKPKGPTSHDIVDIVRKTLHIKKVGHAGTLDPMATGVLVILTGKCTKESSRLSSDDKEYEAELTLGARSDTEDAEGVITDSGKSIYPDPVRIKEAFDAFLGPIEQIPPAYSAVKHKGKKLYELARKGIRVEKEPRKIMILRLDIMEISLPKVRFCVTCSKGTYIRKLAADIGERLGYGAYLSALRRTRSGKFTIAEAITIDKLSTLSILNSQFSTIQCV
ncbi:MAG: tRNA pseudouridine(55) synthase TruB [Candidatus Omnitrophica bacterium]|nr:tRNA pseudouridine(55) synthase TruB [Candidatus Omnitrophota bacterium]